MERAEILRPTAFPRLAAMQFTELFLNPSKRRQYSVVEKGKRGRKRKREIYRWKKGRDMRGGWKERADTETVNEVAGSHGVSCFVPGTRFVSLFLVRNLAIPLFYIYRYPISYLTYIYIYIYTHLYVHYYLKYNIYPYIKIHILCTTTNCVHFSQVSDK